MRTLTALSLYAAGAALVLASARPGPSTPPAQQLAGGFVVPYYGAAYGGGGLSAADGRRIVELLESIDRRLESIEAKSGGPGLARPAARLEPLAVARAKCLSCHTQAKADAKGGGFILFADDQGGGLKPLSGREKVRLKEAVQSGAMPPNGKLSPAEKAAFE